MKPSFKDALRKHSEPLGLEPEALCVRLAKKLGVQERIIVRSFTGDLRIVNRGEKLHLKKDEFIATVPRSMIMAALDELENGRVISESDLDD